ncbi:MAG: hypothetical protein H6766_07585 [Candidatus Peribacteria bacterium]|nr:MAG: hypothetical protein H6766_07585 [Candidatus Peribacteria bacterium]
MEEIFPQKIVSHSTISPFTGTSWVERDDSSDEGMVGAVIVGERGICFICISVGRIDE